MSKVSKCFAVKSAPILLKCGKFVYSADFGFMSTSTFRISTIGAKRINRIYPLNLDKTVVIAETDTQLLWLQIDDQSVETIRTFTFEPNKFIPICTNVRDEVLLLTIPDRLGQPAQVVSTRGGDEIANVVFELDEQEDITKQQHSPLECLIVSTDGSNCYDSLLDACTGVFIHKSQSLLHFSARHRTVVNEVAIDLQHPLDCRNTRFFMPVDGVDPNLASIAVGRALIFSKFDGTHLATEIFPTGNVLTLGANSDYIALSSLFGDTQNPKTIIVDLQEGTRKHFSNRISRWLWTDRYAVEYFGQCALFIRGDLSDEIGSLTSTVAFNSVQASQDGRVLLFSDPFSSNENLMELVLIDV